MKSIGKPCAGKPHVRFDGGIGQPVPNSTHVVQRNDEIELFWAFYGFVVLDSGKANCSLGGRNYPFFSLHFASEMDLSFPGRLPTKKLAIPFCYPPRPI